MATKKKEPKKWLVVGAATVTVYAEVQATSEEEAKAKASELPMRGWEVDTIDGLVEVHDAEARP